MMSISSISISISISISDKTTSGVTGSMDMEEEEGEEAVFIRDVNTNEDSPNGRRKRRWRCVFGDDEWCYCEDGYGRQERR